MDELMFAPKPLPPLPIHYTLFEDKTYLEILREKAQQRYDFYYDLLLKEIENRLSKLRRLLIKKYKQLFEQICELKGIKKEFSLEELKKIQLSEEELNLLDQSLLYEIKEIIAEIQILEEQKGKIEEERRKEENRQLLFRKLIDLLELYPKHLRFGFLSPIEVQALRYISDTYFTLFAKGILLGKTEEIAKANFVILPLILNIQETSLSKDAFFLKLIHGSPILPPSVPEEPKEEPKIEALKKALGKND